MTGHDQRALHKCIAQIGTVSNFIDWFEEIYNSTGETVAEADPQLHCGHPRASRREDQNLDKYEWPNGLELFLHDDGQIKLDRRDSSIAVTEVSNYTVGKTGTSQPDAHLIAQFIPAENTERSDNT